MAYICSKPMTLVGKPLVDDGKGNLKGECVSLVKKYSGAPSTKDWKMGRMVRGASLSEGTAIATFFNGKNYPSSAPWGHAAFYVSQDNDGITVVEQYKGLQAIQKRKIRFKGKQNEKDGVNDGDSYSVID